RGLDMTQRQPQMLEGFHVLDFTHYVAGPTCTRILGELGADVIKVERSLEGDHVRALGIVKDGMSSYYFQHNHCKRSLAVDLRNPRGRELLLAMIPKIDVVVENFAPGVIADMGFGDEALTKINPRRSRPPDRAGRSAAGPATTISARRSPAPPTRSARPTAGRSCPRWRTAQSRPARRGRSRRAFARAPPTAPAPGRLPPPR